jgi:prepilin-type N-terminal cleavage/methylation domain-containing protein
MLFVQIKNMKKGYTLFELLVTISIIAILTAIATVSYGAIQKKARDSRRVDDMESIRKAEEQWYMVNNSNYKAGCSSGNQWMDASGNAVFVFPTDPKGVDPYNYSVSSCGGATYCVCSLLENQVGNSSNASCSGWVTNGTGQYYCVSNQQ